MANKPKMEFLLNVPTVVTLGNNFKNGDGEYGPWFGWGVVDNLTEKTLFADEDLQAKIAPFGKGKQVTIIKSQIPGSRQFTWQVYGAEQFPPPAMPTTAPPQTPQRANTGLAASTERAVEAFDRGEYRVERVARAREALEDAREALGYAETTENDENVLALAISFLIDEQRKGIAPPEYSF